MLKKKYCTKASLKPACQKKRPKNSVRLDYQLFLLRLPKQQYNPKSRWDNDQCLNKVCVHTEFSRSSQP